MSKKGNISLEINGEVVEGPRGFSIKELKYKETSSNGDNVYEVIREDNIIIGEITAKKGEQGIQGIQGDIGNGIKSITLIFEGEKSKTYRIKYTNGEFIDFSINDGEDGISAYSIAVENGFEGTEEEWLLSLIGKGLEFQWNGTKLGVRVEGETEYQYSDDLKGEKGDKGDTGKAFYIAKTYSSVAEMQADFNNNTVKTGEYVIISSTDEDNGKLFEKKASGFEFIVKMSGSDGDKYVRLNNESRDLVVGDITALTLPPYLGVYQGYRNTAISSGGALAKVTTGIDNIAVGNRTLNNNTTGVFNIALGNGALYRNTNGSHNIAIGVNSLYNSNTGGNIGIGTHSLYNNTGLENIGIGLYALLGNKSGNENTGIGYKALEKNTTGSKNVAIGHEALSNSTFNNTIGVGVATDVTGDNQAQIGNSNVTVYCYGAVQNRSDERDKTDIQDTNLGLNFLLKLRPREYRWDYREDYINREEMEKELKILEETKIEEEEKTKKREEILKKYSLENVIKDGKQKGWRLHQGFIAQEVFETMRELGVDFGGYQDHSINGGKDVLSLGYEEFIPILVKGLQEQQEEIKELKSRIEKLEAK